MQKTSTSQAPRTTRRVLADGTEVRVPVTAAPSVPRPVAKGDGDGSADKGGGA